MVLSEEQIRFHLEERLSRIRNLAVGRIEDVNEHIASAVIMDLAATAVLTVHVDRETGAVVGWR